MYVIVGLGNPGREYRDTRHNVGFMVVNEMARRATVSFAPGPSQVPDTLIAKRHGEFPVMLAKPLTFMNRNGDAVAALLRYFDVALTDLLIVVDDAAIPLGRLRARAGGSAGGHNGLKSLIGALGTTEFPRLRLGVGRGDRRRDLSGHVLGTFEAEERPVLESLITRAADAAEMFAVVGIGRVMNEFNPETTGPEDD